jgi:hypothetical protein
LYVDCVDKFDKLELFPNPATDVAQLRFNSPAAGQVRISVLDIAGKEVTALNNETVAGQNVIEIEVKDLAPGVYFIATSDPNNSARSQVLKFIKQ